MTMKTATRDQVVRIFLGNEDSSGMPIIPPCCLYAHIVLPAYGYPNPTTGCCNVQVLVLTPQEQKYPNARNNKKHRRPMTRPQSQ
jgi:hypothetical protein